MAVRRLLCKDPAERMSVGDALQHCWVASAEQASGRPLDHMVVERLQQFARSSRLKRLLLNLVVQQLTEDDIASLHDLFRALDRNGTG